MHKYSKSVAVSLIALSMGFVSCSDDDDDNNGNGNGTSSEEIVKPSEVFTSGLPSQIGDMMITTNEKGQISEIKDDDKTITFQYASVARASEYDMTMDVKWLDNPQDWVKFYIKLNKQGFIASADEVIYEDGGQNTETWAFEYNSDGQMTKMVRSEGNNEVTTITYSNGDIVKVDMKSDPDPEYPDETDEMHAVITNTNIPNKSGIMLFDETYRIDMDEMAPAYFAGLLGKGTKHLPLKAVEDNYSVTCSWTLDGNDMPTSLTTTINEGGYEYTEEPVMFKWAYKVNK